jgi:hypothetical protein
MEGFPMSEPFDQSPICGSAQVSRRTFLERATQLTVGPAIATQVLGAQTPGDQNSQASGAVSEVAAPLQRADDVRSAAVTRYGAYFALTMEVGAAARIGPAIDDLIRRFDLRNEFDAPHPATASTVGFLRRTQVTPGDLRDESLLAAGAVMHLSSEAPERVFEFRREFSHLAPSASVLAGVVRPLRYTGNMMHNYGYAHRVLQQSGTVMPTMFLMPLTKTAAWWKKDWWERHTFFLPRYDESGQMISQGHALAAAAGISCLMRRTYWNATEPAPAGEYDFINYFECADQDIPTFQRVCAALRDTKENPEWAFVREGPTWQGRRVAAWEELWAPARG